METSGRYQETVDTDTFHPSDPPEYERAEPANPGQLLPLPAPAEGGTSGGQQLELGERVQMDHLGPLVIGEDGSVGRIANWTKLSDREREIALRRITARNRERLQRLRGETGTAAQQQGQAGAEAGS
ncbi:fungal specific transcription isoform A [Chlorella sorokiniana]|uniref:Fungal specific transcription isoform A n=1 Tax=Chlorella sorokiniana TaxID=3076 RepID=A0A2P6TKV4_CHLSO|nr:fungal specific transcription isoform B [Chlorella sorokiniana]PRW44909.1 fungal specific transcription isoform A [Chlorella sorokiniana]|eukprot:PRW44908.1 fungal specific transcription isoform B [Chlorella sorokiniana]